MSGARGGKGSSGREIGGTGGVGDASIIPWQILGFFEKILGETRSNICIRCKHPHFFQGGIGGRGGESKKRGGDGGVGLGPRIPAQFFPIDEATRNLVPTKELSSWGMDAELVGILHELGFQTVGGLFEAYDTDLKLTGKLRIGDICGLKAALRKFIAQVQQRFPEA